MSSSLIDPNDDLSFSDLAALAAESDMSIDQAYDVWYLTKARDFKVNVPLHMVAYAVYGKPDDIKSFRALNHISELIILLEKSVPDSVCDELRNKLGQDGVDVFKAAIQKIFLELLTKSKFELDLQKMLEEVSSALEQNVSLAVSQESFDMFEGTEPMPPTEEQVGEQLLLIYPERESLTGE